ncbi:MAG: Na+/H+ antiporter NhaC family protein [Oscillibacter sp.]|nr:Na+/H+ antiporter NhaC family protein [Oscillibacter sp.]
MENVGILSLVPALIAVILAFITKEALFSIFAGVLVGIVISGQNLLFGFTGILQSALGNADFIWVVAIEVFIGIMVAFFQKSGAIKAVADKLNEKMHITARIAQIMASALGVLIFFSDYFSPLFVGNVMRPITDKARVSREKLAWLCDCTSAPVCITLPFTAWGVYVAGLVVGFGTFADVNLGQNAVVHSIPFQLYGVLTILMIFLVSLGFLPDFGPMKKAEERARTTGEVYAKGAHPMLSNELDDIAPKEGFKPNLFLHFLMPALIVICTTIGTYIFMGSAKTLEAFVLAVVYQGVVLLIQRAFNIREMMEIATKGIKSVVGAILILSAAYCINAISKTLGTANFVIGVTEGWMTPVTLLALTFTVCAFISFFTGTSWGTYAIMIPIVMPLAFNLAGGQATNLVYAAIAAVMGGGCFGDHCSPLSDTTILSSLGSGSDHVDHVKTQLPYALSVAVLCVIGYVIMGFCF